MLVALMFAAGCKKKTPVGPVDDRTINTREVQEIDDNSVLGRFLDTLAGDKRTKEMASTCQSLHPKLSGQSICVLEGFTQRPPSCDNGMAYLAARMVTRHFVCIPHTATEANAVFDAVLGFLGRTGAHAQRKCPNEVSWLAFSADVGSVLGTLSVFGVDPGAIKQASRAWNTKVSPVTEASVQQMCSMATSH